MSGTTWRDNAAQIIAMQTALSSGTTRETQLQFVATPPGSTASQTELTLQNGVLIGTAAGGLKGIGTINLVGPLYVSNNQIIDSAGNLKVVLDKRHDGAERHESVTGSTGPTWTYEHTQSTV